MAMVVKNNMSAVNTLNTLNKNQSLLGKSLQKVSSGMKINSAQDDASGYAISERMRVMIRSLDQANQNTQNGSSLMKVAEGAVSNTVEILKTLKEKAINAATDTNTDEDRAIIQKEIDQLVDQIDDNALITFNGKYLLDGSKSAAGDATFNTWTNQSLSEDTTANTKLTQLQARDGEALTIETSDKVTVSYVQNGKTYTTTASVLDDDGNVRSLVDVFKLAEGIDTTTQTFAVSSNDAVQAAGGVNQIATDGKTLQKAIAQLQDQLSYKNNTGYVEFGTDFGQEGGGNTSYIKFTPGSGINAKIEVANAGEAAVTRNGAELPALSGTVLGMKDSYNGTMTQKVTSALENYINASAAAGNATSGAGGTFMDAIDTYNNTHNANLYWEYNEGSIDDAETLAKQAGGTVLTAFNTYKAALDEKATAYKAVDDAVKEYNENLAQLDALLALKDLEDAKTNYKSAVGSYISDIEGIMSGAGDGVVFTLPAGIAGNNQTITYTGGGSDSTEKIDQITSYLKEKLLGLVDELSLMGETGNKLADAVDAIIGGRSAVSDAIFNKKDADGTPSLVGTPLTVYGSAAVAESGTAPTAEKEAMDNAVTNLGNDAVADAIKTAVAADDTFTVSVTADTKSEAQAVKDAADDYNALSKADKAIIDAMIAADDDTAAAAILNNASALVTAISNYNTAAAAYTPASDATGALAVDTKAAVLTANNYDEKLKLVYDNTLADLSGPAIMTGSNVGVDPAGKIVTTLDGSAGLTFMAASSGSDGQIAGFTISISDSDGNVRKSVNTVLNAWSTSVYGKNASAKDNSLAFQIGASANQTITVDMADMRAEALGLKGKDGKVVDVATKANANAAIAVFENALQKALDVQTTVGAIEARLEYTASNLTTSTENVQAAESTIRDADMAKEMTNYTKNNVLLQAAQSMLAQANQNSSAVLSLLQ